MSAKGDCYDNACAEPFFATIKKECIRLEHFKTRSEARLKIVDYIVWYNAKRRHSYLGDISLLGFERNYYQNILDNATNAA
jgi:putative transposase